MKKLYYPKFKCEAKGYGEFDFEEVFGEGRFITYFVEEFGLELEGIKEAKKWKKDTIQSSKEKKELEEGLINYIIIHTELLFPDNFTIVSIDYYDSDKVYCTSCDSWHYADDSCDC